MKNDFSNDLLYNIIKHVENSSKVSKFCSAQMSKENRIRKFTMNSKKIDEFLKKRIAIDDLKKRNILKDDEYTINFDEIHSRLNKIIHKIPSKLKDSTEIFIGRVSINIYKTGKDINFGIRKKILKEKIARIYR